MAAVRKSVLGKGFDVLMPTDLDASLLKQEGERVQNLFVTTVFPNPDQPRRFFDDNALEQLAESIKHHGILQPLIVSPTKEHNRYIIVAGERRWRAAKLAKLEKIPAIIRTAKELEKLEIAIVENIQRVDLSPLEQAASIHRLHDLFNVSFDDISKRLGKAPSTINNIVRLLQLTPAAQQALREEKITEGHARSLLSLKDFPEAQQKLLVLIQKNGWSVRQAEQFVVATKSGERDTKIAQKRTKASTPATEALSKRWNRSIGIKHMAKGGKLEIGFASQQDLEKLIDLLEKLQ